MKFKEFLLDLVFPIQCVGCARSSDLICSSCFNKIKIHQSEIAKKKPGMLIDNAWSVTDYDNTLVRQIIHQYKYRFVKDFAGVIGELFKRYLDQRLEAGAWPEIDLVVPVPLSARRYRHRGFNQSELAARIISEKLNKPLAVELILRDIQHPQVGLSLAERQQNIQGNFRVTDSDVVKAKTILLVDDVITTGATLNECAKILKKAGAGKIFALTIASR